MVCLEAKEERVTAKRLKQRKPVVGVSVSAQELCCPSLVLDPHQSVISRGR